MLYLNFAINYASQSRQVKCKIGILEFLIYVFGYLGLFTINNFCSYQNICQHDWDVRLVVALPRHG